MTSPQPVNCSGSSCPAPALGEAARAGLTPGLHGLLLPPQLGERVPGCRGQGSRLSPLSPGHEIVSSEQNGARCLEIPWVLPRCGRNRKRQNLPQNAVASEASPLAREGVGRVDVGLQRGSCCCPRPGIAPSVGTVGFAGSDTEPFITVASPCLGSALSPRTYFIRMHSPAETKAHKAPALSLQVQRLKLSLPYFTDAIPQDTGNGY